MFAAKFEAIIVALVERLSSKCKCRLKFLQYVVRKYFERSYLSARALSFSARNQWKISMFEAKIFAAKFASSVW